MYTKAEIDCMMSLIAFPYFADESIRKKCPQETSTSYGKFLHFVYKSNIDIARIHDQNVY